jgi:hypothetical protein
LNSNLTDAESDHFFGTALYSAILKLSCYQRITPHGGARSIPEESFSSRKIEAGKALLLQVQTQSLPALRKQLSGLMQSLATSPLENEPNPKRTDALEFAKQIGPSLSLIERSLAALSSTPIWEELEFTCNVDHEYGILKRHKVIGLSQQFDHFLSHTCASLIDEYVGLVGSWLSTPNRPTPAIEGIIIEKTDEACHIIDAIIESSKRSDFSVLQEQWQDDVDRLSACLNNLNRHINHSVKFREGHSTDEDASRNNPGNSSDSESDNDDLSLNSSEESTNEVSESTSSQENVLLNLDLIPRIRRTIPLLKLGRIFFSKLLDTPKSKTPFTLSPSVSSYDMGCMKKVTSGFCTYILKIVNSHCQSQNEDELRNEMKNIMAWSNGLSRHFDSSMMFFAFFLIPDPSRIHHGVPEDHLRSSFFEFRCQLHVALEQLFAVGRNFY